MSGIKDKRIFWLDYLNQILKVHALYLVDMFLCLFNIFLSFFFLSHLFVEEIGSFPKKCFAF